MSGVLAGFVARARVRVFMLVLVAAGGFGGVVPVAAAGPKPLGTGGATGVEVPGLRTEFSQTRQLAGGVLETTVSSRAVNFKDAAGVWRRIDNGLVPSADGTLKNGASAVDIEIPRTAGGEVRFADGRDEVSFSLVGATAARADVKGEAARFEDAAEDVDLEYEAAGSVLKETLTLASADAPAVYRFDVDAGGLRAEVAPSGDVVFVDGDGRRRLGFAAPWMKDADGLVSRGARYEIERVRGATQVVLRLDKQWLENASRRYPVMVDPTVYSGWEHLCEIRSGARSATTYCDGALSESWVGRDANGIVYRNLFELQDLSDAVPAYGQVLDSWFAVYLNGQSPVEPSDVDLHRLTSGFAPGATWTRSDGRRLWSRAGGDYDPQRIHRASTSDADPSDGWLAFDMTALARSLVAQTEPSPNLLLKAADESRTHIDSFNYAEVKVRWTHRTGISPLYTYETRTLSDGSTLSMNVANGNLVLASDDIGLESDDGRFTVGRFFNSLNLANEETTGSFGPGSRGDFGSIRLDHHWLNDSYIFSGPGAETGVFDRRADGTFTPPVGMDAVLTELPGGGATIDFNDSTETWTFDQDGRLVQTRQDYGYTIDGTYGPDGLATLRDSAGQTATFDYDGSGDLRTITDQDDAVHRYDYDNDHRLTAYTSPTGAQTSYTYDSYNRLIRIGLPDRTALRIVYHGNGYMPYSLTPVNAAGIDQPATRYSGDMDWTEVIRPATPRQVYFFDPATLIVDLIQTGDDAAISTTGPIPTLDGGYTRGDRPLTVDVSAAQARAGIQLTELEVDDVEVDSIGAAPCDWSTCPTRARETLAYDPTYDPEGRYEYRVNTIDGDDQRTNGPLWRLAIDRTAPTSSGSALAASFYPDEAIVELTWTAGVDPPLPGESTGQPIAQYQVRYRRDGGPWSAVESTSVESVDVSGSYLGELFDVEITAFDAAGNAGPVYAASITTPPEMEVPDGLAPGEVEADDSDFQPFDHTDCELAFGAEADLCYGDPDDSDLLDAPVGLFSTSTRTMQYGIAQDGGQTAFLSAPVFTDLRIRRVRRLVAWNLMDHQSMIDDFKAFVRAARGRQIMVTFNFGCRDPARGSCYTESNYDWLPNPRVFANAIQRFQRAFPMVRYYGAWNEPNHDHQPTRLQGWPNRTPPAGGGPKRAALYAKYVSKYLCQRVRTEIRRLVDAGRTERANRLRGNTCDVVVGEFHQDDGDWRAYASAFTRELIRLHRADPRAGPVPRYWSFHPYRDIRLAGDPASTATARYVSIVRGVSSAARVWFTEAGSRVDSLQWTPETRRNDEQEQSNEVNWLFTRLGTRYPEIQRIYYYSLCGPEGAYDVQRTWDSGLLGRWSAPYDRACVDQPRRLAWRTLRAFSVNGS